MLPPDVKAAWDENTGAVQEALLQYELIRRQEEFEQVQYMATGRVI